MIFSDFLRFSICKLWRRNMFFVPNPFTWPSTFSVTTLHQDNMAIRCWPYPLWSTLKNGVNMLARNRCACRGSHSPDVVFNLEKRSHNICQEFFATGGFGFKLNNWNAGVIKRNNYMVCVCVHFFCRGYFHLSGVLKKNFFYNFLVPTIVYFCFTQGFFIHKQLFSAHYVWSANQMNDYNHSSGQDTW